LQPRPNVSLSQGSCARPLPAKTRLCAQIEEPTPPGTRMNSVPVIFLMLATSVAGFGGAPPGVCGLCFQEMRQRTLCGRLALRRARREATALVMASPVRTVLVAGATGRVGAMVCEEVGEFEFALPCFPSTPAPLVPSLCLRGCVLFSGSRQDLRCESSRRVPQRN